MKADIVSKADGNRRVIAIFAGWAMDSVIFEGIEREGYDIVVISDYTDFDANSDKLDILGSYAEIVVIGWSMGVIYGGAFIASHQKWPITATIAVNGSTSPRNDLRGIPVSIYDLTGSMTTERQLESFYRRVCGGKAMMSRLMPVPPRRDVVSVTTELAKITAFVNRTIPRPEVWDTVVITVDDLIFPIDNLRRCWTAQRSRVVELPEGNHLPDFGQLIDHFVIDKDLVGERFGAAMPHYNDIASVQSHVARTMSEHIMSCSDIDVLEIGAGAGLLTGLVQERVSDSRIMTVDLVDVPIASVNGNKIRRVASDGELLVQTIDNNSFDLIVSSSTMQWFNSPRRFVREIYRLLRPGGTALLSTYGSETFRELREVSTAISLPYRPIDCKDIKAQGAVVSERTEMILQQFDSPRDALSHLRNTGVNAVSRDRLPVSAMRRLLGNLATASGRGELTYQSIILKIKKPEK